MKCILFSSLSVISLASPALTELGVVGPVVEAKPYYEQFILKSKGAINTPAVLEQQDHDRLNKWSGDYYPYDSGLTPGRFTKRALDAPLSQLLMPVCLIANDAVSAKWLHMHRSVLTKIKPVCYLVRAASNADLNAVEQLMPDIRVVAVNPKYVVDHYGVPHYPALISKQGIEQ